MITWPISLFNVYLQENTIPKMWRRASVVAVLKPGIPETSAANYQTISLLCTIYKLSERIILNRIKHIVDPLFPNDQAGFRKDRSNVDQVC